jgi:hypothetical protein
VSSSIVNTIYKILGQHPEVVAELSNRLHLPYLEEKSSEGNVCFVNSEEVRPEFRETFTPTDVTCYLIGLFKTSTATEVAKENFHLHFPYPQNADVFWLEVENGRSESEVIFSD